MQNVVDLWMGVNVGTKRERIFDFEVQRPVDYNERNIQKVIDEVGHVNADIKYDGIRGIVFYTPGHGWRIVTRENIEILSIAGIIASGFCGNHSHIYDCEVVIPDVPFDTASGLLRAHAPLAPAFNLQLYIFDAVSASDKLRVPCNDARSSHHQLFVRRAAREICSSLREIAIIYETARNLGFEGLVIKNPVQPYTPGKVQGWWKMKPAETLDGIITGFIDGTKGKANEGLYVGFKVKLEDGSECNADGLTKDLMAAITAHPDEYLGRYVEIQRMEASSTGASRHPKFKRFRDSTDNKGVKI